MKLEKEGSVNVSDSANVQVGGSGNEQTVRPTEKAKPMEQKTEAPKRPPIGPQFDKKAYAEGQLAWKKGTTLKDMVLAVLADKDKEDQAPTREERDALENKSFSRLLGFGDGVLETLRRK